MARLVFFFFIILVIIMCCCAKYYPGDTQTNLVAVNMQNLQDSAETRVTTRDLNLLASKHVEVLLHDHVWGS
uniref:Putative secreted protein n=1 Tax=Ixodes ricinus TaxID=34613 RepID=A0A6B0TSA7_IXORI